MSGAGQNEQWETADGEPARILLGGRFSLHPDRPLPHLDAPTAKAYAAADERNPDRPLFCLVCDPAVPPRRGLAGRVFERRETGCLLPVAEGACFWPPLGRSLLVIVYEQPRGPRLDPEERLGPAEILERVLLPAARVLQSFSRLGIAHRAIRPDNLFWSDPERRSVVLGDWLSAPPGFGQPPIFETMERACAHPAGRGSGSVRDDMFALGMTALTLCGALRQSEASGIELLFQRADQGSVAAFVDEDLLPPSLASAIRALLCDDPTQRWNPDALLAWLSNERVPTLRGGAPATATRPLVLDGRKHLTLPSVALGLCTSRAAAALRDGEVERWLRGAARSEKAADAIAGLLASVSRSGSQGARADDTLTCRASLLLDPGGPIRFGSLSVTPEALGTVLYVLVAAGEPVGEVRALLEAQIPAWLPAERVKAMPGFDGWISRIHTLLAQHRLGAGLERCIYEMNPDLPCLGPLVGRACVLDLASLLDALEENARAADFETTPIDAHVAAFAVSRLAARRVTLPPAILDAAGHDRPFFELGLLAGVQQALGTHPVPLLSRWLTHRVKARFEKLHNRRVRRRLVAELQRRGEAGDLTRVFELVRHPQVWRDDERGLAAARLEHARHQEAARTLEARREALLARSLAEGQELAVTVAASLAIGLASLGLILQVAG